MSTPITKTRIPAPLYAAAGAGDLAYRELRKLSAQVVHLQERVSQDAREFDVDKLRDMARRNAEAFAHRAQTAQDRAVALYNELVVRGERVVRREAHAAETVAAEIEQTAASDLPAKPAKKVTRPAAQK